MSLSTATLCHGHTRPCFRFAAMVFLRSWLQLRQRRLTCSPAWERPGGQDTHLECAGVTAVSQVLRQQGCERPRDVGEGRQCGIHEHTALEQGQAHGQAGQPVRATASCLRALGAGPGKARRHQHAASRNPTRGPGAGSAVQPPDRKEASWERPARASALEDGKTSQAHFGSNAHILGTPFLSRK